MRKSIVGIAAISLATVFLLAASVLAADVSRGEFYTEEEYQKLGGKEREAYCASLANEADRQASMLGDAEASLAAEQARNSRKVRWTRTTVPATLPIFSDQDMDASRVLSGCLVWPGSTFQR